MRSIVLICCLLLVPAIVSARPSFSSRSYSSGSFRSSTSVSRPAASPTFRSSPAPSGGRTYAPAPRVAAPIKSSGTTTSRTYAPVTPPPRAVFVPTSRPYSPVFVSHGYYNSYGSGGMPWWGWLLIFHNQQQSQAAYANGYGSGSYQASPVNWAGVAIWIVVLAVLGGGVWYYVRRTS